MPPLRNRGAERRAYAKATSKRRGEHIRKRKDGRWEGRYTVGHDPETGKAIARRIGTGMKIVVGDKKIENAQAMAKTMNEAGFDVAPVEMDLSSRESIRRFIAERQKYGPIQMLVNAAGMSPSQAPY